MLFGFVTFGMTRCPNGVGGWIAIRQAGLDEGTFFVMSRRLLVVICCGSWGWLGRWTWHRRSGVVPSLPWWAETHGMDRRSRIILACKKSCTVMVVDYIDRHVALDTGL